MKRRKKKRGARPVSRPRAPREPLPEDCCGQGCTPCVFDRYAEQLEKYRVALLAWNLKTKE